MTTAKAEISCGSNPNLHFCKKTAICSVMDVPEHFNACRGPLLCRSAVLQIRFAPFEAVQSYVDQSMHLTPLEIAQDARQSSYTRQRPFIPAPRRSRPADRAMVRARSQPRKRTSGADSGEGVSKISRAAADLSDPFPYVM